MPETKRPNDLPDELRSALKTIIDHFEIEDRPVRERQIRQWKQLELYWSGFTRTWWDEVAHDWRILPEISYANDDQSYYDKQANVFRAFLESIIAALSSTVPNVRCLPDDADNMADVLTAKGGTKIGQLIYKHIDAELLWVKALFVYCTQGMIAAYNYSEEDEAYGTVPVAEYENEEQDQQIKQCPLCGAQLGPADFNLDEQEKNEFDPDSDDILARNQLNNGKMLCTKCLETVDPEIVSQKVIVERIVGETHKPKARQCIDVNGGLYVKVPNYARKQKDTPYIAYCYETHYTNVYARYPFMREQMDTRITSSSGSEIYERWGRLSPQYRGEYPLNTPTVRNWWLRTSSFEIINDDKIRKELVKRFPDGCKTVWVNEDFVEACNESLDDHWTLTYNPLSEYIHFDPLGLLLVSIQDITSDLLSLTMQTIEHGIAQTWVDPKVVDLDAYRQTEALPGGMYPVKNSAGKSIGDSFYEMRTASLAPEVQEFGDKVQELGEFISGALPSIWGGSDAGGNSRTAAQASMSRNQALQRLQTPWKMLNAWWKNLFGKVIPAYIKNMLDDERYVTENHGSFINTVIERAQLDGKIGDVELDSTNELPQSPGQIRDAVMQLMQLNNPEILQYLSAPENIEALRETLGMPGFTIPGEVDREKQYDEIQILVKTKPINDTLSSVGIEPLADNHAVQAEICRNWLVGESGRLAKDRNPDGYKNVLLHLQEHVQAMAPAPPPPMMNNGGPDKPMGNLKPLIHSEGNPNASGNE